MKVNTSTTHEMTISLSKSIDFPPVTVNFERIEKVQCAKLVGVYIQSNLKWSSIIDSLLKSPTATLFSIPITANTCYTNGYVKMLPLRYQASPGVCRTHMEYIASGIPITQTRNRTEKSSENNISAKF